METAKLHGAKRKVEETGGIAYANREYAKTPAGECERTLVQADVN